MEELEPSEVVGRAWNHFLAALQEHMGVDAVQVIFTTYVEEETSMFSLGHGNFMARLKTVETWLDENDRGAEPDDESFAE